MIQLIVILILVGLLLYVVETFLPIDKTIKKIIHVVVIVFVVLWLLSLLGLLPIGDIAVPRVR